MGTITTLRPSSTSSGVGWTPSAGTLHGATSDDNDATYATWSGDGSALILATPVDAPPDGERRHQVRLRARGEDGNAWWAVRLSAGNLVAGAAALFGASPETVVGSWGTGAPAEGSTVLYAYVTGQTTGVRITELYLDVDSRLAPTFTPQILDGSGAVTTTISDTAQPTIRADSLDLDGLAARQYRYRVTLAGTTVWDTGTVSGAPTNRQVKPLDNGTYVAYLQVWSTLGANTAYASEIETLEFTVSVGTIPVPDPPAVVDESPFYEITVCAPDVALFDGAVGWAEVQRVDCARGGYLLLPGISGAYASTPDEPIQDGDLEVTVLAARDDGWRPVADETLAARWLANENENQRIWRLFLDADGGGDPALAGRPALAWSTDGTAANVAEAFATDRVPIDPYGRVHLRVLLDVDNGSGGWTVTFEYLNDEGEWALIGEPVTGTPVTVIHPSDMADTSVGAIQGRDPLNLNPYFEVNTSDWFAVGGAITRSTAQFHQGVASLLLTPDGVTATSRTQITTFEPVIEGAAYTMSLWARCSVSRNVSIDIAWYDGDQVFTVTSAASTRAITANTWTRIEQSWTAPAGTGFARPRIYMTGTPPANNLLYVDEAEFTAVDNFLGRAYLFQVRVGRTGDILTWADFTNHAAGTEMFTDDTGNAWSVYSSASLASSQELTSVAILGPLASDECATWTDFTLPRSGVGRTCEHEPDECCSYYRARTIVREDGQLLVSDWSAGSGEELFCLVWSEDEHLIRTTGPNGPMYAVVLGKFEWTVERPFTAATGVMGSRFVTSAPPGGRNLNLTAAVENEAALAQLHAVLSRPLVLISPSDANEVWAAPVAESVRVIKIGRIRQVTASFTGTGPEPPPQTADVGT